MAKRDEASGLDHVVSVCEAKGLVQGSHHGRTDFRLDGNIVVNVEDDGSITIKLPLDEQQALLAEYPDLVSLPTGWGHHGWTTLPVDHMDSVVIEELIDTAIRTVASAKRRRAAQNRQT